MTLMYLRPENCFLRLIMSIVVANPIIMAVLIQIIFHEYSLNVPVAGFAMGRSTNPDRRFSVKDQAMKALDNLPY